MLEEYTQKKWNTNEQTNGYNGTRQHTKRTISSCNIVLMAYAAVSTYTYTIRRIVCSSILYS